MKNFLFILFLSPVFLFAQNRVGINTNAPAFKLDIRSLDDSLDAPDLQLATPSANHFLRLFAGRSGDPRPFLLFSENDTFRIATSGSDFSNFTERLTLLPDGKVGINNLLPERTLHVLGDGLFGKGSLIDIESDTGAFTIIDSSLWQLSMDGNEIQAWDPLFSVSSTLNLQRLGGNLNIGGGDFIVTNTTGDVSVGGNLMVNGLSGVGDRNIVVGASGDFKIGPGGDTDWTETATEVYNVTHNIGVGIYLPTAKLHILGPHTDLITGTTTLKILTEGAFPYLDKTMFIDGDEIDVSGGNNRLRLQGNSTGGITMVKGGGNVGIGTGTPQLRKLTVKGSAIPSQGDLETSLATFSIQDTGQIFNEMVMDGNEIQTVDDTLFINSKSAHDVIIASGGGSVAIGTSILATGFRLSVDGGIIGDEVRVQYLADWPDYVFADDYDLTRLEDLELSILKNKHLPGMPSSDEVKENGIDLGRMQGQIVEMLEELTLHMIELNKRIRHLEAENDALRLISKK
jgi:hypothetical protein